MKLLKSSTVCLIAVGLLGSVSGCSRDKIEAINLANEGDQSVKINVEGAIQKYEQAIDLDPTNHRILWKLANAYEKKEDWDKMASTLVARRPGRSGFRQLLGCTRPRADHASARPAISMQYKQAQEPLKKCIEKDPNSADCYNELGETYLWTDDEQARLDNYSKAIEHDPSKGYFYADLAEPVHQPQVLQGGGAGHQRRAEARFRRSRRTRASSTTCTSCSRRRRSPRATRRDRSRRSRRPSSSPATPIPEFSFMLGSTYANSGASAKGEGASPA